MRHVTGSPGASTTPGTISGKKNQRNLALLTLLDQAGKFSGPGGARASCHGLRWRGSCHVRHLLSELGECPVSENVYDYTTQCCTCSLSVALAACHGYRKGLLLSDSGL